MPAPKHNQYWQFRNKHGRDFQYTPESLWEEAIKYFKWIEENPLWESVVIQRGIKVIKDGKESTEYFVKAPKMRAMTIAGFCLFADICEKTFANYRDNEDFVQVITRIEKNIYAQKFEGAAAALLHPNIIARDLGLKEHNDITSEGEKLQINIGGKEFKI